MKITPLFEHKNTLDKMDVKDSGTIYLTVMILYTSSVECTLRLHWLSWLVVKTRAILLTNQMQNSNHWWFGYVRPDADDVHYPLHWLAVVVILV